MLTLLLWAGVASAMPPASISEVEHAIAVGRFDQARLMISRATAAGATGEAVDRLVADLALATKDYKDALRRYELLLAQHPTDQQLLERAAVAAVAANDLTDATDLAERATASQAASWKAWNTRAVVADLTKDFATADSCYARATALAPNQPEVLNNMGWSRLLRGDWTGAIEPLEQAVASMPASTRAMNNLELARTALSSDLPQRRAGESDRAWASRLNDAGVAAQLRGERARAIAAFSRALEAQGSWYERAANNLAAVTAQK